MTIAPLARTLILYEGAGEGSPFGEVVIPDIFATLANTFGTSNRPVEQVEGATEALDEIDALLQQLGV